MEPEVLEAVDRAIAAGFTTQTVTNDAGQAVTQIYDGDGVYIASGTRPEWAWLRAYNRGFLPE